MLSRGVCPLKTTFDLMRVWAAITGLVLVAWFFAGLGLGYHISHMVPMMAVAIGGFELMLFGQDLLYKRGKSRG